MRRSRMIYAVCGLVVIILGLASRADAIPRPALIAAYGGDTLWALFVFVLVGWLLPASSTRRVALITLAFSLAIELSQLYQAPWLDAIRQTLPGRLVLGAGFLWSDLICYAVGVSIGVGAEVMVMLRVNFLESRL